MPFLSSKRPSWLGQWRCLSAEPGPLGQPATIAFSPARDREYEVVLAEDDTAPGVFSGYASAVSGGTILNLREQDGKDSGEPWTLVRYSFLLPNVRRFELVADEPLEGEQASPATLLRSDSAAIACRANACLVDAP